MSLFKMRKLALQCSTVAEFVVKVKEINDAKSK